MPLYEDMAPWNIFFEAGKLIYIDYDTRNLHFDEAVPMAYQVSSTALLAPNRFGVLIMDCSSQVECLGFVATAESRMFVLCGQVIEVLMNYKRTVQDFQRCDSHATTQ